ncbi:hypothetical protein [Marinobacter shengliensis]|uniref:hypothetical protein n=1 Tax=Marinobacter shengliensis TaxID=1389223 RepID=UPI001E56A203|nr:hypothetical protein [Marinobacter shengliensis]MCD1631138.1 hypothetical protein [Marinobacter shengliensis]
MKYVVFLVMSLFFISGCSGDNPSVVANKGGVQKNISYEFKLMKIDKIRATENASQARYCIPFTSSPRKDCWSIQYRGDLSDFEDESFVNIKINDGFIVDIDPVWFTTRWGYMVGQGFLSHSNAVFFARYLFIPIVLISVLIMIGGAASEKDDEFNERA